MSTKTCPFCAETIQEAAIKCRYCGSMLEARPATGEWYRDPDTKMLAGVCSGLARQFGVSATALRIAFVVATFIGGWGVLIYLALWIIMPPGKAATAETPALPELPKSPPPETSEMETDEEDSEKS